jgi:ribosomal protein L3
VVDAGDRHRSGWQHPPAKEDAETDGYNGVKVGFDTQKEATREQADLGRFKKAGSEPKKLVKEFRLPDGVQARDNVDLSVKQFAVGDVVDVIGRSKGHGFQGVVKKHNMDGQNQTHGSMMHRRNGAIGMRSHAGPHLEEHGHAWSHGRRARDRAEPQGRARCARKRASSSSAARSRASPAATSWCAPPRKSIEGGW